MDNMKNMSTEVNTEPEVDVLDLLLSAEPKGLPEKEFKIKRLSRELGQDVIFRLRALTYKRTEELCELESDMTLHIVLEGVVSPKLKTGELLKKYKAPTGEELLRNPNFLLAGEVAELAAEIEKLSGFRVSMLEEVKKN